jgi:hypothetical protein
MDTKSKQTILDYLKDFASKDEHFATKFKEAQIDGCCNYIMEQAKKMANGNRSLCVDADTVFGWARHYFLEELWSKAAEKIEKQRQQDEAVRIANKKRLDQNRQERYQEETGQMSLFDLEGV